MLKRGVEAVLPNIGFGPDAALVVPKSVGEEVPVDAPTLPKRPPPAEPLWVEPKRPLLEGLVVLLNTNLLLLLLDMVASACLCTAPTPC
jgi:hypothetical protein